MCGSSTKTEEKIQQQLPAWVNQAAQGNVATANWLTSGILPNVPNTPGVNAPADFLGAGRYGGSYTGASGDPGTTPGSPGLPNIPIPGTTATGRTITPASSLTAGFTQDQLDMFDLTRGLADRSYLQPNHIGVGKAYEIADRATPNISAAQVGAVNDVTARRGVDLMGDYKSGYTNDVVNSALADYGASADKNFNALTAKYGSAGAFGDDRQGVAQGQFAADTARGMGSLSANLRDQAFKTAAGYGMNDANRYLTADQGNQQTQLSRATTQSQLDQDASRFNVNAGLQSDQMKLNAAGFARDTLMDLDKYNNVLANNKIDLLGQIGDAQQGMDQAQIDDPFKALQFRAAQLGLAPYPTSGTGTSTTTKSGGLMDFLAAAAKGAAAFA